MAIAFDTLAAAQRMEDADMDRKHAAAVATTAREAADSAAAAAVADRDALATKVDLSALRADLLERIQASERRTYAAVFAAAGLLFAALKLNP